MKTRTEAHDGQSYGIVELTSEDGYHAGTIVTVFIAEDGAPIIEIETPQETETHELVRVHLNDARARWEGDTP